ncbi:MAG: TilS substrate-binding domain-containing protein [Bifidobacteriaceae bacterium]|nr:TilS substrate-binding domain-containing protein [Bifidobacteriaceae bacterium]
MAAAHPAVRGRALRRAALAAGTTPGALSAAHLAALDALVANWHGQGPAYLPGGIRAERKCGKLVFRFGSEPNPGEPTDPTRPGGGVRGRK